MIASPPPPTKKTRGPVGSGRPTWIAGLLLLFFLSPAPLFAAERLTLQEGIATALRNHPALKAAGYAVEAAEAKVTEARGGFLPRVDLSETFSRTNGPGEVFWTELSQKRFSLPDFAAGDPNDPDALSNYNTRVTLVQPLYTGGKLSAGYRISELQREGKVRKREETRQQVIRNFTTAYYKALLAEHYVEVAEKAREAVEAHLKTARDLLAQGMVLRSDLLQAQVRLSEIESRLITAKNQRRLALSNLDRIMGVDQGRDYLLVGDGKEVPPTPEEEMAKLIAEAKEHRPDLAALKRMKEAADEGVHVARSAFLPQVNLVARYDQNDRNFLGNDGDYWSVMAVAGINLFEGLSGRARVARARADAARMSSLVTRAEEGVELQVRQARLRMDEAWARLEVARKAVAAAEAGMKIVEDRYKNGMGRITELLDTETALTRARTDAASARYDLRIARTDLDFALGRLSHP